MKEKKLILMFVLIMGLVFTMFLTGCSLGAENYDNMEEPEITVDYLSGEFAEQLLRDGGEEILGTIEISDEGEKGYSLTVKSMVVVESSASANGYYIADKNISTTVPLDEDACATYIADPQKGPQVMELDKFIKKVQRDSNSSDSDDAKLYNVYIIGGNALLLLAEELPS